MSHWSQSRRRRLVSLEGEAHTHDRIERGILNDGVRDRLRKDAVLRSASSEVAMRHRIVVNQREGSNAYHTNSIVQGGNNARSPGIVPAFDVTNVIDDISIYRDFISSGWMWLTLVKSVSVKTSSRAGTTEVWRYADGRMLVLHDGIVEQVPQHLTIPPMKLPHT